MPLVAAAKDLDPCSICFKVVCCKMFICDATVFDVFVLQPFLWGLREGGYLGTFRVELKKKSHPPPAAVLFL